MTMKDVAERYIEALKLGQENIEQKAEQLNQRLRWWPIETAPKDGTNVLVWIPERGVHLASWDEIVHCHNGKETYRHAAWSLNGMMEIERFGLAEEKRKLFGPTYWMPLPQGPTE